MTIERRIDEYIASQAEPKRADMQQLHRLIRGMNAKSKLWFLDGRNDAGKVVSNPNIGYGSYDMTYADGSTREFYQVGLSATSSGISVYIMDTKDKKFLAETYAKTIGKASVTGYCIRFKSLKDINVDVLTSAIRSGFGQSPG